MPRRSGPRTEFYEFVGDRAEFLEYECQLVNFQGSAPFIISKTLRRARVRSPGPAAQHDHSLC